MADKATNRLLLPPCNYFLHLILGPDPSLPHLHISACLRAAVKCDYFVISYETMHTNKFNIKLSRTNLFRLVSKISVTLNDWELIDFRSSYLAIKIRLWTQSQTEKDDHSSSLRPWTQRGIVCPPSIKFINRWRHVNRLLSVPIIINLGGDIFICSLLSLICCSNKFVTNWVE